MPERLLASGRAADVFDLGDGTVLRRYRGGQDTASEARLMTWLADNGFPPPVVRAAAGHEIVMDKVTGPTMIEDLARRPWRLVAHARTLARIQKRLNALDAPDWLPARAGVPDGRAVVHLDLHPLNVMLTGAGPVVIDWTNATRSSPDFDAAVSYVLMRTADATGTLVDRLGRRAFVGLFRLFRGRRAIDSQLANAAGHRIQDPNVTPAERQRLSRLAAADRA